MKYVNQLSNEELTEIYKSFMAPDDKFIDLSITRFDHEIALEGHICIPEEDEEYADEDGYCKIDEDYSITDYNVQAFHHNGDMSKKLRKFLYKKFGIQYAEDFLLG